MAICITNIAVRVPSWANVSVVWFLATQLTFRLPVHMTTSILIKEVKVGDAFDFPFAIPDLGLQPSRWFHGPGLSV